MIFTGNQLFWKTRAVENDKNLRGLHGLENGSLLLDVVQNDSQTMTGDDYCGKKPDEVVAV